MRRFQQSQPLSLAVISSPARNMVKCDILSDCHLYDDLAVIGFNSRALTTCHLDNIYERIESF